VEEEEEEEPLAATMAAVQATSVYKKTRASL
jgi:hypothetical protein